MGAVYFFLSHLIAAFKIKDLNLTILFLILFFNNLDCKSSEKNCLPVKMEADVVLNLAELSLWWYDGS